MMKRRTLFQNRRTRLGAVLTTAAAFLLLGSTTICSAKGKPRGGGGETGDPPPIGDLPEISATPLEYEAHFFDSENPADWAGYSVPARLELNGEVFFNDINRDGIAVGQISYPDLKKNYGILATTAGGMQELDAIFAESLATPDFDGFRVDRAYEINADGWTACSMIHSSGTDLWVAVGNIHAGDSLKFVDGPFSLVLTSGLVSDMNEDGDLIIVDNMPSAKRGESTIFEPWLQTATQDPSGYLRYEESPLFLSPFFLLDDAWDPKLNTHSQISYRSLNDSTTFMLDLNNGQNSALPEGPHSWKAIISDDGSVYTYRTTKQGTRKTPSEGVPSRWSPKTGLHALAAPQPSGSNKVVQSVSAALVSEGEYVEALLSRGEYTLTDDELAIFRHDGSLGTMFPVRVSSGELMTWDATVHELVEISRPNGTGRGLICGSAFLTNGGNPSLGLILTPLPLEIP